MKLAHRLTANHIVGYFPVLHQIARVMNWPSQTDRQANFSAPIRRPLSGSIVAVARAYNDCGAVTTSIAIPYCTYSGYAMTLSPNPSGDFVDVTPDEQTVSHLAEQSSYRVLVYDQMARLRLEQVSPPKGGPLRLDVRALPQGLYTLHVRFEDHLLTERLRVAR